MSSAFTLTFLGTGTSVGVPVIGCQCEICLSEDPKNHRLRSSVLLNVLGQHILIDAGPDLRQQALRSHLTAIEAVLYTHCHLDHVSGFDELRAFCWHRDTPLPMYATESCMNVLKQMYGWAFDTVNHQRGYIHPDPKIITGSFELLGLKFTPLPLIHGNVETIGFFIRTAENKTIGYIPDVKIIAESSYDILQNVDILILDSLRYQTHPTHFNLAESLAAIERIQPKQAYLTHLCHEFDYHRLLSELPERVSVAYDGLILEIH